MGVMKSLRSLEMFKADPDSTAATLEAVAGKHIAEFSPDLQRASVTFVAVVGAQVSLAQQLFGAQMVEHKAREWFAAYARKNTPQGVGAAQAVAPIGRGRVAAPETISAGGLAKFAPSLPSGANRADPINGGGQTAEAPLAVNPVPPTVDTKPSDHGRSPRASPAIAALPLVARPQSRTDIKAAASAAQHIARTVFDSYRVRDGRALGDIKYGELDRLIADNTQEAAVLRQIRRHIIAPSDAMLRDVVKVAEVERFIQRGAEFADVA